MPSHVAICTDSSSLLSEAEAAGMGVEIVPIPVTLDGVPFDERMSSLDWFYERLRAGATAHSSPPAPADFADAYARAAARGARSVVSIHFDSRATGTTAAAELAARDAELPVTVVDSRTGSFGVALCVRAAVEAVAAGGTSADAVLAASRRGLHVENAFAVLGSPGGRVPPSAGWMIFRFTGGVASPIWQCASIAETVEQLATHVLLDEPPLTAAVGHAGRALEAAADELAQKLESSGRVSGVERYRVGASLGASTGPDSLGAFWWPAGGE
jgi:DegV family protein with EDD domain